MQQASGYMNNLTNCVKCSGDIFHGQLFFMVWFGINGMKLNLCIWLANISTSTIFFLSSTLNISWKIMTFSLKIFPFTFFETKCHMLKIGWYKVDLNKD